MGAVLLVCLVGEARLQAGEPTYRGKGVNYWISALSSSEVEEVVRASTALVSMRGDAVPYLVRALQGSDARDRIQMMNVLSAIGPSASTALPVIVGLLDDPASNIRVAAASSLVAIDRGSVDRALPVLIEGLRNEPQTASMAAMAIGSLRQKGAPAVPSLIAVLEEGSEEAVRIEAARALWKIGPAAKAAIPALESAVQRGGPLASAAAVALETVKVVPGSPDEMRK
jgi:HEAT repeat protein